MSQTTCGGDGGRFNRRAALATMGAGFGLGFGATPAQAHAKRAPVLPEDEGFMRMAIEGGAAGRLSFGAVIVRDGAVWRAAAISAHGPRPDRARGDGHDPSRPGGATGLEESPAPRSTPRANLA